MYFANDGGIYRALNGFTGLTTGLVFRRKSIRRSQSEPGFDDPVRQLLRASHGSEHYFRRTQDNGSPATATATTSSSWGNILSGDGGYNALDPNTMTGLRRTRTRGSKPGHPGMFLRNQLHRQQFHGSCEQRRRWGRRWSFLFPLYSRCAIHQFDAGGDVPVWQGPRSGGAFTLLSLNFDTLGTGTCTGTEVNLILALAAGGLRMQMDRRSSMPPQMALALAIEFPGRRKCLVTTNATAVSGRVPHSANVTLNGPSGSSINPNQFRFPALRLTLRTRQATRPTLR